MAGANLPAKKYSKSAPTILRLSFVGNGNATQYIDIAQALSIVNRKFYRQGVYYYVNSIELYNNEDAFVDIHTIPDNWVTKNAWNRGFGKFQEVNKLTDVPRPKYHDFKVFMTGRHHAQHESGTSNLLPSMFGINGTPSSLGTLSDDWDYSQYTSADDNQDGVANADEFHAHMIGPHDGTSSNWTSVGLITSYADSRARPESDAQPETPIAIVEDPLVNLFDMSSEEMINDLTENLREDNVLTPYDVDYYIGEGDNQMQQVARLATSATTGRIAKASGFCVPMGLLCIDPQSTATAYRVVLNIAAGTYHGVYAERA
jgi:hypothetical protein